MHAERAAPIEDLTHLDDAQRQQPSRCGDWSVHDVVAHLVESAHHPARFRSRPGSSSVRLRAARRPRCASPPGRLTPGDAVPARRRRLLLTAAH
ncbi:maleylpyruvate isomerase N-terminal domain-containing protein [Kineococcus esterisolvens]|uniref:maleylpyruvate isomerase N-terminal domain-containing protein n=1 Tax=unclassified Kineococcus TaxID=2621656 RepID=UPI003D7D862C